MGHGAKAPASEPTNGLFGLSLCCLVVSCLAPCYGALGWAAGPRPAGGAKALPVSANRGEAAAPSGRPAMRHPAKRPSDCWRGGIPAGQRVTPPKAPPVWAVLNRLEEQPAPVAGGAGRVHWLPGAARVGGAFLVQSGPAAEVGAPGHRGYRRVALWVPKRLGAGQPQAWPQGWATTLAPVHPLGGEGRMKGLGCWAAPTAGGVVRAVAPTVVWFGAVVVLAVLLKAVAGL